MADAIFEERRLAEIYDPLDPDRSDLDPYLSIIDEINARALLDIGCGTGTLACLAARRGVEVTALDPAASSLAVARRKRYAERVRWIMGDATTLPPLQVDVATMTGNVAQVFLTDDAWTAVLRAARAALRPGGRLLFEVRDPAYQGWREWSRPQSFRCVTIPGVGDVDTWVELTDLSLPFVSFRTTFAFRSDGAVCTSDSTLRFRGRTEIVDSLLALDYSVEEVREAPDRPRREFVFIARRTARGALPPPD